MFGDTLRRRWFGLALALSLLLAPRSPLPAATITGTIYGADGDLFTGTMLFRTLRTPLVSGSTLVTGGDYRVNLTNGALSTTLLAGDYRAFIGADPKGFIIAVPSGSSSYSILGLITNAITYTDQSYPWQSTPPATASISGTVKTDVDAGDPVVYLKSSIDALLATNAAPSKLNITNGTAVNLTGSLTNATYDGATVGDRSVIFPQNLQALLETVSPPVGKLAYVLDDAQAGDGTKGIYRFDPDLSGGQTATVFIPQDKHGNESSLGRWVRMSAGDNYQMSVDTLDDALAVSPAYLAASLNPTNDFKLTVKTRARKALGRGGAATYRYSATAPASTNLGSVVPYGSGYLVADPEGGVINVRQFGAYGDGVTDDTAAIDSANDWAKAAQRTSGVSTVLYLPRGNYLRSTTLALSGQITLRGDGLETGAGNGTSLICTGDNIPAVTVTGSGFGVENIEIRYQTFQDSTKTNSVALQFIGDSYKFTLDKFCVRAGYTGIGSEQSANAYNGTINNPYVRSFSHGGIRMRNGGTVITWNNPYVQNLANVQSAQTATITNVTLSNGTNIVFRCGGTLPPLLATNRQFAVTGLDSAYNGVFFVRAISGLDVYCDAASTLSAPSDITGTLTFYAQPCTGYPVEFGNGDHVLKGLDVEHVVTDADAIIYAPTLGYIRLVDAHIEAAYRSTGGLYFVHSPNGMVDFGTLGVVNLGFNPGSTNYAFRNETAISSLTGVGLATRDIAFTGATWLLGSAGAGADYPMLDAQKAPTTYRANATGYPTGDGQIRYRLGGGNKATSSSGTDNIFSYQPVVTQSGTARYYAWMINPTATTLGSGTSYPLWVGENSTNYYRVSNRGAHVTEADVAQTARFMKREDTGDEVALSYGSATDRKTTFAANSQDTLVKSTSAAAAYTINPSGGALVTGGVIELGHASDTTLARSAAGQVTVEGKLITGGEFYEVALSDETTAITTGTAKVTVRAPFAMTVTGVRASLSTVSSSGTPTVDINESGTTILSTKLTIDASEKTSTTAATAAVISDSAIADDAELTFDIDTAGTGAAGLKVRIYYTR